MKEDVPLRPSEAASVSCITLGRESLMLLLPENTGMHDDDQLSPCAFGLIAGYLSGR